MPEGLEAEIWRRSIESLVGRTITDVWLDERVADPELSILLPGERIDAVERRGKVVRLSIADRWLGLHFGMTGRVVVDGASPIASLEYASDRDRPEWDRLRIHTDTPGAAAVPALRVNDPRRLGRSSLDADLGHLGVDIFEVTGESLVGAVDGRRTAIKTLLLDQRAIAGLGNLCADEVLWWAGIAPHRPAREVGRSELDALARAIRRRLPIMLRRGGSTMGVLDPASRSSETPCSKDGAVLRRDTIGGRTAVWCAEHQR